MVILVTYDLNRPGKNYTSLYNALGRVSNTVSKPVESVWLFQTNKSSNQVYNLLRPYVDDSDRLFVVRLTSDYIGWLDGKVVDWLAGRVF